MIRFYDNDILHVNTVREMCPYIETFHVKETNVKERDLDYARSYEGKNTYAKYTVNNNMPDKVVDALTEEDINDILLWSELEVDCDKKVLFDFDCTLSRIEGVIIPSTGWMLPQYGISYADVAVYLMGGTERFTALENMFKELTANDVEIFILTNNAGCNSNKPELLNIIHQVYPELKSDHLLCSGSTRRKHIKSKGHFLKEHPEFGEICSISNIEQTSKLRTLCETCGNVKNMQEWDENECDQCLTDRANNMFSVDYRKYKKTLSHDNEHK